jgi:hypothetical protein
MPSLLVMEVLSSLPMPLVSNAPYSIPYWNQKIKNCVYVIFLLCKQYLRGDGVIIIFHDNDPIVLK